MRVTCLDMKLSERASIIVSHGVPRGKAELCHEQRVMWSIWQRHTKTGDTQFSL
jgi:hypothetical protein